MNTIFNPRRYDMIHIKNPREIIMLRGNGCKWRRCTFCDYHLDYSRDESANFLLNSEQIAKVTGIYHKLEVINSGSFPDLDPQTIQAILNACLKKQINEIHFECHWIHRGAIDSFRSLFASHGINLKIKLGVETFDYDFREHILDKGIDVKSPQEMAVYADEICLLFGLEGQTLESMQYDIETGLSYFERICINIMADNSTAVKPCSEVIILFKQKLYDIYKDNDRIDILLENTEFGVGKELNYE